MTAFEPSSLAFDTASVMPLSLKEPVGLRPSNLKRSLMPPVMSLKFIASIRGVLPSPKVTIPSSRIFGRSSLNSLITPFQRPFLLSSTAALLYPHVHYFVRYRRNLRYVRKRLLEFLFLRAVSYDY